MKSGSPVSFESREFNLEVQRKCLFLDDARKGPLVTRFAESCPAHEPCKKFCMVDRSLSEAATGGSDHMK
jgi:hypothetical protein